MLAWEGYGCEDHQGCKLTCVDDDCLVEKACVDNHADGLVEVEEAAAHSQAEMDTDRADHTEEEVEVGMAPRWAVEVVEGGSLLPGHEK